MIISAGTHLIDEPITTDSLIIEEGATLTAPEGKYLTLTANGLGRELRPGRYDGDVRITLADSYVKQAVSMGENKRLLMQGAVFIRDGKLLSEHCAPGSIWQGEITDRRADGLYVASSAPDFCGVVVDGDSEYVISNSRFDFTGAGSDDFMGMGSAIAAYGRAKVAVNNTKMNFSGVTRCAVHVGGESVVYCTDCDITNWSPAHDLGDWSWGIAVRGTNRLTQLTDNGTLYFDRCRLLTNGWGVCSIDGSTYANMFFKDSSLTLTGPDAHGYGAFCIGPTHIRYDHTEVDVYGYPIFLMGMGGVATFDVFNGSVIRGRRFGALIMNDDNGVLTVRDSMIDVGKAVFVVKGSASAIRVERSVLKSGSGVILQLMDNDEIGFCTGGFPVPIGLEDVYTEGRDLTDEDPALNVVLEMRDMYANGDIFNSTTDLRQCQKAELPPRPPMPEEGEDEMPPLPVETAPERHNGDDLKGAKNLVVKLDNANIKGLISSAKAEYAPGVSLINEFNREELSNITQLAAPTVNNGVIVRMSGGSVWTVTGECWLTALEIAAGSAVKAADPKKLRVFVNGEEIPFRSGPAYSLRGKIRLTAE